MIKKRNNRVEEKLQLTSFASSTAAFSVERMDAKEEKFEGEEASMNDRRYFRLK